MNFSELLKDEHSEIRVMMEVLGKVCDQLDSGKKVDSTHLEEIVQFFKIFTDKCHHGKEEDFLFPAMERYGIPKEGGPIGMMLYEHGMGREYIKNMSSAIADYKSGNTKASTKIVENARNYIDLLTQHIFKEENILYPLGEFRMPEDVQRKLLEDFEELEEERIGPQQHQKFLDLVETMKKIYLD